MSTSTAVGGPRPTAQRATKQGAAVLDVLAADGSYRSAQEIHAALRSAGNAVGLTTVYRHLQQLTETSALSMVRDATGEALYRRCEVVETHHHHVVLVCRRCGRSVEVDSPEMMAVAHGVATQAGFAELGHTVEMNGVCATCASA